LLFGLSDRLKQFDSKGDPTHTMPIVLFPFSRLLNRHGFTVLESWGFPEDGNSPTSRLLMRLAARTVAPHRANTHRPWRHAVFIDPAE
jgi:hypothetical protein